MRILFISNLLSYGGASKLLYDLLPRMKEKGYDCELLILTDKQSKYIDELENIGIPVYVVPNSEKGHIKRIQYLKNWIKKGHYDIVHVNLFPAIYYCSMVKILLGKRCPSLVMTEHSTDNKRRHKPYLRPIERFIYNKYEHIISISVKTQENLCKWLRTEGDLRFSVIENGIDIDVFKSAKPISKNKLCESYNFGDVLLLMVGSFTPQKNHAKLLEALSFLPGNYKLLLAGEGPLQNEIKSKAKELDVQERVFFLGFRRDIASIMHSVDMLVIPSIWEGFGLIAAEGMACGLPIAASDVPGLSEIVGDVGVKFTPTNPKDIAQKIKDCALLIKDNALIEKMSRRVSKYDINRMVDQYLAVYNNL